MSCSFVNLVPPPFHSFSFIHFLQDTRIFNLLVPYLGYSTPSFIPYFFLPSFLSSLLPSLLPSVIPSLLPDILLSSLPFFLPPFILSFLSSFLPEPLSLKAHTSHDFICPGDRVGDIQLQVINLIRRILQYHYVVHFCSGDPKAELVRHFLIEPTLKGVKLKGCSSEPVFGTNCSLSVAQLGRAC